jgi:hypothetical protein
LGLENFSERMISPAVRAPHGALQMIGSVWEFGPDGHAQQ